MLAHPAEAVNGFGVVYASAANNLATSAYVPYGDLPAGGNLQSVTLADMNLDGK